MHNQKTYCFISNYLTPHQLPFCLAMQRETGGNFIFIETEVLPEERRKLGYPNLGEEYDFVLSANQTAEAYDKALEVAAQSDVVIIGSAPDIFIKQRLKENKLTFRFSERIFKKRYFDPLRWVKYTLKNFQYRNKNLFFLLSSAYAPHDYKRCGVKPQKMLKWGYFPAITTQKFIEIEKESKKCVWVGRFLDFKHPEDAVYSIIRLNQNGYRANLDFIGVGELEDTLQRIVKDNGAEEYIHFLGSQPYQKVREYMKNAEIFLFTSDYNEGWGAVLNEAMDSGCAIVTSHTSGSVPYLIEHEKNGLIYSFKNKDQLYEYLRILLTEEDKARLLGQKAKETVVDEWNADCASIKLINFCEAFFAGDYQKGVCKNGVLSYAEIIPQKRMYQKITKDI